MSECKTFGDLYYFLKEDFGNFILFGHHFSLHKETVRAATWLYINTSYECNKCQLRIEAFRRNIIMFETETGIEIDKELPLLQNFPSCEKRCDEKIIKEIIE